jgi:hypothetical protein
MVTYGTPNAEAWVRFLRSPLNALEAHTDVHLFGKEAAVGANPTGSSVGGPAKRLIKTAPAKHPELRAARRERPTGCQVGQVTDSTRSWRNSRRASLRGWCSNRTCWCESSRAHHRRSSSRRATVFGTRVSGWFNSSIADCYWRVALRGRQTVPKTVTRGSHLWVRLLRSPCARVAKRTTAPRRQRGDRRFESGHVLFQHQRDDCRVGSVRMVNSGKPPRRTAAAACSSSMPR